MSSSKVIVLHHELTEVSRKRRPDTMFPFIWDMSTPIHYNRRPILKDGNEDDSKQTIFLNLSHDRNDLASVMNEKTKQMNPKHKKKKLIHDSKDKLFSRLNVIGARSKLQTSEFNIMRDDDCCSRGGGGVAVDQNDSTVLLSIESYSGARSEHITYCHVYSGFMISFSLLDIIIIIITFIFLIIIIVINIFCPTSCFKVLLHPSHRF